MGETIAIGPTGGYLATPEMGAGPAVLVITEPAAGEHRQRVCDGLAVEGFTALGPELRNGHTAADLDAAIDLLRPHPAVRGQGIGVVGFSTGSALAWWLAAHRPDDIVALDVDSAGESSGVAAAVQVHDDEDEDERLAWIRTLEFLRKHLG
jgi:dienelactone hydrolase